MDLAGRLIGTMNGQPWLLKWRQFEADGRMRQRGVYSRSSFKHYRRLYTTTLLNVCLLTGSIEVTVSERSSADRPRLYPRTGYDLI